MNVCISGIQVQPLLPRGLQKGEVTRAVDLGEDGAAVHVWLTQRMAAGLQGLLDKGRARWRLKTGHALATEKLVGGRVAGVLGGEEGDHKRSLMSLRWHFRIWSMKNSTLKGLAGLGQLSGLVVTEIKPEDAAAAEAEKMAAADKAAQSQRAKDVVRVHRETKGRGGKAVSLIKGISLADNELQALGKQLKNACGSGGTVKDGVIEVQGDHGDRLVELLKAQGYNVKRAGG